MLLESFHTAGSAIIPNVLPAAECATIASRVQPDAASAGTRCLLPQAWCAALARHLRQPPALSSLVPVDHVAVQCTYFEKSAARNWLVPIHQDLSIPVVQRVDAPGLRGWSEKEGTLFVQAPAELLAQLVAVRVHLDVCGAAPGDALVMRPLLLHASSKATGQSRRRVLHFLFGPRVLTHGLAWRQAV